MHVGLIAGGGALPHNIVKGAEAAGYPVHVAAIEGSAGAGDFATPARAFPIASFGAITKYFRKAGVTHVCMAGNVARPDFSSLKPDLKALRHFPNVARAARHGDDALLRALADAFEAEGFSITAPQELAAHLLVPEGTLGRVVAPKGAREDILKACETARAIGRLDIGQAAVVCNGVVLAVEAQEGTAAMLARVVELPAAIRGTPTLRNGILAKMLKPSQDSRTDLPTIGLETVELADRAGLAGIVVEAGNAFILDRDAAVEAADAANIFILGLPQA